MPKKTYPENIQKLKDQLETGNNLIDYFFICGVSPTICQNEELYNISNDNYLESVKNLLKPSILCKFPEFDNNNDTIDEGIINYCFPDGFEMLYNNASSEPKRKIFSIILDNNLFSSEYPQKYVTCCLFYEKLSQYKKLQQQIDKIEQNKENNDFIDLDETLINSIRNSLKDERNQNNLRHNKMLTSILPSINIDDHVIEDPNIEKMDFGQMRNTLNKPIFKLQYYYIPKCICLVSIHPYVKLYQKILSNIHSYGCATSGNEIPIEKIITNLIIEVPIPPRGLYSINYNYSFNDMNSQNLRSSNTLSTSRAQSQFLLQYAPTQVVPQIQPLQSTENNKLLVSEIDLKKFNRNLTFACKMETIKHILLGSKILFFSINLNTLSDIILSFLCLIFPFKYPFQVSSFLHKNNYNILESISPFIIGINEEYSEKFFEKNDITLEGMNVLVVDLDSQKDVNYHLFTDEEFPEFPNKLMANLEKEIKSLETNNINNNVNDNKEKIIRDFNEQYQEKFFHFFCEILKGYEDFLNLDFFKSSDSDNVTSIETLFKCDEFIKNSNHSQSDIPFYTKFINDSQLFADFIYKRMIPRNNNELMDILIVNDYLLSIKKKLKFRGKDTEQNDYKINNKYIVPRPKELSEEEKNKVLQEAFNLSLKAQIIKRSKNPDSNNNNNNYIVFNYTLFPVLDFNIYCNNENVNQYIPPPDYSEEIDAINSDVISKSSLGQNMNRALEMKNYLYLTWLEMWAFTFWYNEHGEKHYRFDQMLDVLDKVIHHEMNILNLMFDVLNKHGEPSMLLKLYQKLLQLKINPSTFIYDIMSSVLDKKQIKNLLDEMKKNPSKQQLKFKDSNPKNNRERTFLSINDNLPLETKPRFYYDYSCIYCTEKINIYLTCKNFEGIRNDIIWVKCNKCGEYNLPKIIVKFGLDFITTPSKSTSIEDFVVHSPYNLKINIKNAVVSRYGMDISVSNFKSQSQAIFWNFIWYSVIHNLDYNILLPYSKTLEQLKETLFYNPNRDIFEVSYDDNVYKENQNKIERISLKIKQKNENNNKKNKFENLKVCSAVLTVELSGGNGDNNLNTSFEIKEDVEEENNDKNDLESFMNMRPKIKMFDDLDGLDDVKEDDKKKEDDKDEELIKDPDRKDEKDESLLPRTSW